MGNNTAAEIALIAANPTATLPVEIFENFPTAGIIRAAINGRIHINHAYTASPSVAITSVAIFYPPKTPCMYGMIFDKKISG